MFAFGPALVAAGKKLMPEKSFEITMAAVGISFLGLALVVLYFMGISIIFIPAKLGGVLAMFGSIAILYVLPFLDKHPHRSSVFRPWYRITFLTFVAVVFVLGVCGGKPAEGFWVPLSQLCTLYYFAFFLVVIPFLNKKEPVAELPPSINDAVLMKNIKATGMSKKV